MDNEHIPMIEPEGSGTEEKKEGGRACCAGYMEEIRRQICGDDRPLSPASWIGVNILMLIPPVNLLFLFLWACGGTERTNLKNYARGVLLTVVLFALAFLVFVVVLDLCGYRLEFPKWLIFGDSGI